MRVVASCAMSLCILATAAEASVGPPLETRLNTTGHPLTIPAQVMDGGEESGEVPITIGADDSVAVERTSLEGVLKPRVSAGVMDKLATIAPGLPLIPVKALDDVGGVRVMFNPGAMSLELKRAAVTSNTTDIVYGGHQATIVNHQPANVSAFVNMTTSVDAIWDSPNEPPINMNLAFDGAARFGSTVIEGEGRVDGPLDNLICPAVAECSYQHKSGFKRLGTRLVREFDSTDIVLTAGDIAYSGYDLQRGNDLAGFSLTHDGNRFGHNNHLNNATSLLALDSPADVDVLVNGAPLEHLHLNTGSYRISDLPLVTGSNDVQLLVTTADGQTQKIVLSALAHDTMLKPGTAQWSVNGGIGSYLRDSERAYVANDPVANGYLRVGLSSGFTGDVHAQADSHVAMVGGDLLALTPIGLVTVGLAGSEPLGGAPFEVSGYAVKLAWDFLPPAEAGRRSTIHLGAQYESSGFQRPGDQLVGRNGILFPTLDPELLVSGSWTVEMLNQWVISASGRYEVPNKESDVPGAIDATGTRWGGDLAVTVPLTQTLQGTLWCSYGNEHLLTFSSSLDTQTDFTVGTRIAWQPNSRTDVNVAADSSLKTSTFYAATRSGTDNNGWQAAVSGLDNEQIDSTLTGSLTHQGRFEQTSLVQSTGFNGNPGTKPSYEQTSLRSTTAIAYADGHVALGPPIRDGFAIITPHASLPDSEIIVGDADAPLAKGSTFAPAVLNNLPSHVETRVAVDATNVPAGYSLGDGNLDVRPPYKAGYAVEVGSDHAMSAYGILLDQDGAPLSLTSGTATKAGDEKPIALFTNAAGRFGVEGLSSGEWTITVAGPRGPLTYALSIPSGQNSLIKTGALSPREKGDAPHAAWTTVLLPGRDDRIGDAR